MADQDSQDRNLPASEKKLRKAREDGQVARSRDLGHFAAIGGRGAVLVALAPWWSDAMTRLLEAGLRFDAHLLAQPDALQQRLAGQTVQLMWLVLPLGAVMAALALAAALAGGGWVWSTKALAPQFSRMDPIAGLPRMISGRQLGDALKASVLALLLGLVGALYLRARGELFAATLTLPLPQALGQAGRALLEGMLMVLLVLAAFAVVDLPLQRHLHRQRLKMSHQEQKQEHKENDGNPEIKSRIKQRMREISRRRMLAAVPKADLVVMNPTHYAVALRYDEASMGAPRVVAKGADLLALRIRDIAADAAVPVLQAASLARALYAHAEIDQEVPPALFAAVAQVLAYVYQLRAALRGDAPHPAALPELSVPAELDPHAPAAGASA